MAKKRRKLSAGEYFTILGFSFVFLGLFLRLIYPFSSDYRMAATIIPLYLVGAIIIGVTIARIMLKCDRHSISENVKNQRILGETCC